MAKEAPALAVTCDDGTGTGQVISNDVMTCDFATPRGEHDTTGVDKTARERLLGLADFTATFNGHFNDAANLSHAVFKTIPSTSINRQTVIALSAQTIDEECIYTDYALSRAADGSVQWTVPAALSDGTVPAWS